MDPVKTTHRTFFEYHPEIEPKTSDAHSYSDTHHQSSSKKFEKLSKSFLQKITLKKPSNFKEPLKNLMSTSATYSIPFEWTWQKILLMCEPDLHQFWSWMSVSTLLSAVRGRCPMLLTWRQPPIVTNHPLRKHTRRPSLRTFSWVWYRGNWDVAPEFN